MSEGSSWTGESTAAIDINDFNTGSYIRSFETSPDFSQTGANELIVNVSAIPEPGAFAQIAVAVGILGLGVQLRKKHSKLYHLLFNVVGPAS